MKTLSFSHYIFILLFKFSQFNINLKYLKMLCEFYQIFKKFLLTENKMSDINDFLKHLRSKDYFSVC